MIIKPLFSCIALSLACAFTSAVNAKEAPKASQSERVDTIANSHYAVDPAKIQRLSEVKASLGISGIADHAVKAQYGKELNTDIAERISVLIDGIVCGVEGCSIVCNITILKERLQTVFRQ